MTVTVRREVVLPVAPEELWPALTEPEQVSQWFGADVELDLRPGGRVSFRWDEGTRRGVVEDVEPNRRLAFQWGEAAGDGDVDVSRVEFRLEPVRGGTRLRVTESGLEAAGPLEATASARSHGAAWELILGRLRPLPLGASLTSV